MFNAVKQAGGKVYFTGNRSFIPGKEGQVDWLLVHAGVVASGKMVKDNPNTLKAVLRALKRATATINTNRDAAVKIVAAQMKMDEAPRARHHGPQHLLDGDERQDLPRHGRVRRLPHSLNRIPRRSPPEGVFYTKLLEDVDPTLVKWKAKTEVKCADRLDAPVPLALPPRQGRGGGLPRSPVSLTLHVQRHPRRGQMKRFLPTPHGYSAGAVMRNAEYDFSTLSRDGLHPRIEIRDVQANHEVLGELAVVEALEG